MRRFAHEAGVIGRERIDHADQRLPAWVADHMAIVLVEGAEPALTHSLSQSGGYQLLFAIAQVQTEFFIGQAPDSFEFARFQALALDSGRTVWNLATTHGCVPS